jgi:D-glycero-D-manno-heptose 1,7-bisphosphate phosphatase
MAEKFVIFDRDGTLIDHVHHLVDLSRVKIKSDAIPALKLLRDFGFKLGVITNQSVVGRGLASLTQVEEINSYIMEYFMNDDLNFEFFWMCPHVPEDNCSCRKPNVALGIKAINQYAILLENSYFIGDQETDMQFSDNLGLIPVQIGEVSNKSKIAVHFANSLLSAVTWIIDNDKRK